MKTRIIFVNKVSLIIEFPYNFFNGTISYSQLNNYTLDYDFPVFQHLQLVRYLFLSMIKIVSNLHIQTDEIIRNKTSGVLAVVSNCNSEWEEKR